MDANAQAELKNVLQAWISDRRQTAFNALMEAWGEAARHLEPDEELMSRLAAAIPEPLIEELPPIEPLEPAHDTDADLGECLDGMENATTQGEVLRHLLDGMVKFCERGALFVVKQGIATVYAHRGFEGESPRNGAPVVPPAELENLIQGRVRFLSGPGQAYQALLNPLSTFVASEARVLPLRLRRKVVAVILADSGLLPGIEQAQHVRALVLAAEARLAIITGAKEEDRAPVPEPTPSSVTQRIPDTLMEPPGAPALDPKVRVNAERSARVLVGDIELYFPAKVTQGQQQGNLYQILKEELERSRASFVERYGADLESQHQIFYQAVIQMLCSGDPGKLGPAPWATR